MTFVLECFDIWDFKVEMEVPFRALRAPRAERLGDRSLSEPELHRRCSQIMMPEPMGKYNAMRRLFGDSG